MAQKGSLEDLQVWQRALDLVDGVYAVTKRWPKDEVFGLTNQIRRAAVSIPSNIAEGQGRRNDGDFLRFLAIALGSLMEVKTQLIIAQRQGFATSDEVTSLLTVGDEIARMLVALRKALTARKSRK
ncbi:MAG: four helix bundle protein [Planctomycetes bacterium]|nr:four helix bundle protein [Planctomycetota bacterium]